MLQLYFDIFDLKINKWEPMQVHNKGKTLNNSLVMNILNYSKDQ